jgi:hypothetical protein
MMMAKSLITGWKGHVHLILKSHENPNFLDICPRGTFEITLDKAKCQVRNTEHEESIIASGFG